MPRSTTRPVAAEQNRTRPQSPADRQTDGRPPERTREPSGNAPERSRPREPRAPQTGKRARRRSPRQEYHARGAERSAGKKRAAEAARQRPTSRTSDPRDPCERPRPGPNHARGAPRPSPHPEREPETRPTRDAAAPPNDKHAPPKRQGGRTWPPPASTTGNKTKSPPPTPTGQHEPPKDQPHNDRTTRQDRVGGVSSRRETRRTKRSHRRTHRSDRPPAAQPAVKIRLAPRAEQTRKPPRRQTAPQANQRSRDTSGRQRKHGEPASKPTGESSAQTDDKVNHKRTATQAAPRERAARLHGARAQQPLTSRPRSRPPPSDKTQGAQTTANARRHSPKARTAPEYSHRRTPRRARRDGARRAHTRAVGAARERGERQTRTQSSDAGAPPTRHGESHTTWADEPAQTTLAAKARPPQRAEPHPSKQLKQPTRDEQRPRATPATRQCQRQTKRADATEQIRKAAATPAHQQATVQRTTPARRRRHEAAKQKPPRREGAEAEKRRRPPTDARGGRQRSTANEPTATRATESATDQTAGQPAAGRPSARPRRKNQAPPRQQRSEPTPASTPRPGRSRPSQRHTHVKRGQTTEGAGSKSAARRAARRRARAAARPPRPPRNAEERVERPGERPAQARSAKEQHA